MGSTSFRHVSQKALFLTRAASRTNQRVSSETCELFRADRPSKLLSPLLIRKILVSVKFLSAILGPEMAASILWTPGKNAFLLQGKPMSIKFPVLGGGGILGLGGGGADFIFMGARIFLNLGGSKVHTHKGHRKICSTIQGNQCNFEVFSRYTMQKHGLSRQEHA